MRKSDVVAIVADVADISQLEAENAVSAIFEQLTNALARGEAISLVGFGGFTVKQRAERRGRNPKTGDELLIPASKSPHFKPGKFLKDAVNK